MRTQPNALKIGQTVDIGGSYPYKNWQRDQAKIEQVSLLV